MTQVYGVGIDLVEVATAERLLGRWGEKILRRLLTDGEREYLVRFDRPAKHFAVRLAAKEAVYKSLQALPGARLIGWRDIEVERDGEGRPTIRLHGDALELARQSGVRRVSVSLSHTETTAGAVALAEGE